MTNSMDWESFCIIDRNRNNEDITERIASIERVEETSRYTIIFNESDNPFNYGFARISFNKKPEEIKVENQLVFIEGRLYSNVKRIIRFGSWCKVLYSRFDTGEDEKITFPYEELTLISDRRRDEGISQIIDYLTEVASIEKDKRNEEDESLEGEEVHTPSVELSPLDRVLETDDDKKSYLYKKLEKFHVRADSVLNDILDHVEPVYSEKNEPIIAPFSSNEAQMQAIKNALFSRISVIQGPPGTGKTQTILNIIANLIVRGKTIAVAAGNNEATRNVFEKLDKEHLGSLCAELGNKKNIEKFFSAQPKHDEIKEHCKDKKCAYSDEELTFISSRMIDIYKANATKAKLRGELKEIELEMSAYGANYNEEPSFKLGKLKNPKSSSDLLKASSYIETVYSSDKWKLFRKPRMLFRLHFWPRKNFLASNAVDYL